MSQTTASSSRKRKQAPTTDVGTSAVKVQLTEGATEPGPAFVNFPPVRPSKSTPFTLYHKAKSSDASTDFGSQRTLIAGETGDVEFFSINKDEERFEQENFNCQYVPALYDPSTKSLVIHPSAPTYIIAQRVKRLKNQAGDAFNPSIPYEQRLLMRNQLGEAFGTRKAKTRIKTMERNKVDAAAHEGVKDHLMLGIEEASKAMPSVDADSEVAIPRFIPPPNMETTDPSKVYPVVGTLIPVEEFNAITVDAIARAGTDKERMELMPFRSSRWIEQKLRNAVTLSSHEKKKQIKILFYIACMRQFVKRKGALGNPETLVEQMNHMPKVIIDGLIKRFTETSKGSTKPMLTGQMEAKLLSYQFALRLAIENQACELDSISTDLQMRPEKVRDIFKSLGCTIDMVDGKVRERMGISMEEAKSKRRAVLQAPPEFPKIKRGAPSRK